MKRSRTDLAHLRTVAERLASKMGSNPTGFRHETRTRALRRQPLPEGWEHPEFDDSDWGNAKVFSVEEVRPRADYKNYDFEGADFIWTESLELDNTLVFRLQLDKPPSGLTR